MPWYTTQHTAGVAILRLRGDGTTRVYQWLGGLDGLVMRGHTQVVVSLELISITRPTEARFLTLFAGHINAVEGDLVFVPPVDAHSQKVLHHEGLDQSLPFASSVGAGLADLALRRR